MKLSGGLAHDLPKDLSKVIHDSKVGDLWESLTPIGRNEFICWVEEAKQEKTRIKRMSRSVEELNEGKKRPCCWHGCIHRTDKMPSKWQQEVLVNKIKST